MEFRVKPQRDEKVQIIIKFEELLEKLNIEYVPIDKEVAKEGYKLRAKYKFLKGMDALRLGAAIRNNCLK